MDPMGFRLGFFPLKLLETPRILEDQLTRWKPEIHIIHMFTWKRDDFQPGIIQKSFWDHQLGIDKGNYQTCCGVSFTQGMEVNGWVAGIINTSEMDQQPSFPTKHQ